MSHYMSVKTKLRDLQALARAIARIGVHGKPLDLSLIEVHPQGATMRGYQGHTTAHLIIRQNTTHGLADVGYVRQPDGTLALLVDDYDAAGRRGVTLDTAWQAQVTAHYGCELAKREMARRGLRYTETTDTLGRPVLTAQLGA